MLRILIVEDQSLVAMELEDMLAMAGHQSTGTADDLQSAVAAVDENAPDLALVDIQLAQGESGLTVAAALRARAIPVLFATGNCPGDAGAGLALGCVHKPITDALLSATLYVAQALLAGQRAEALPSGLHLY